MDLTAVEQLAARMFFNVSVQAAFALEDPNVRFAVEFQRKDMAGYKGAVAMADVLNEVYETKVGGGAVALETKPKTSPALSRVLVKGARRKIVMDALIKGFEDAEYFTHTERGEALAREGSDLPEGSGNRAIELVIDKKFKTRHNVAILFAWEPDDSGDGEVIELSAWPLAKGLVA